MKGVTSLGLCSKICLASHKGIFNILESYSIYHHITNLHMINFFNGFIINFIVVYISWFFSHMSQSLWLWTLTIVVGSQLTSKIYDTCKQKVSSRFTCVRSYSSHVYTKFLQSMLNQPVLLFQSHLNQCLEAHPCVPHVPLLEYVIYRVHVYTSWL